MARSRYVITHRGKTLTIYGWAKIVGVHPNTLEKRIKAGWDAERTLTTPTLSPAQTRVRKLSLEDRGVIKDLRSQGISVIEIAKSYGISRPTVYAILNAENAYWDPYAAYRPKEKTLNGQDQL